MSTKSVLETKTIKNRLSKPTGVEANSIANKEEQTFPTELGKAYIFTEL